MNETFQLLTGCTDETMTSHFINKAILAITKYLNNPNIDVEEEYSIAVVELARYYYNNKNADGIASMSQGGRSVTYSTSNSEIPDSIKALLPHYASVV